MCPIECEPSGIASSRAAQAACVALLTLALGACGGPEGTGPDSLTVTPVVRPVALTTLRPRGATIGSSFTYDATESGHAFSDPIGKGLHYEIEFAPHPNGLKAVNGIISGVPLVPLTMNARITAIDANGGTGSTNVAIVAFDSALRAPVLPSTPFHYGELPQHYSSKLAIMGADNTPADNVLTDAGVALGRVLFYDQRLSANDRTSCASCHQQQFNFADTARKSAGFAGFRTSRHSMALTNVRFYKPNRFFWDERAPSLEALALMPIQDPIEMGLVIGQVESKLEAAQFYGPLFAAAFGTPQITTDRVARALAQFLRALVSYDSRFDRDFTAIANGAATSFTAEEQRGLALFDREAGCTSCHQSVPQLLVSASNTGLDAEITDVGAGRGMFKVPSLRNVAVSAPYMHDGRFKTLEEVIDFYDLGVKENPNLSPDLRDADGHPQRLNLSSSDKAALVAFLRTLTDESFLHDPRFADPFPKK